MYSPEHTACQGMYNINMPQCGSSNLVASCVCQQLLPVCTTIFNILQPRRLPCIYQEDPIALASGPWLQEPPLLWHFSPAQILPKASRSIQRKKQFRTIEMIFEMVGIVFRDESRNFGMQVTRRSRSGHALPRSAGR